MARKSEPATQEAKELLRLIDQAREPVLAALRGDEELSLVDLRYTLRAAFYTADGKKNDLDRIGHIDHQRLLPYAVVHLFAADLQRLAVEAIQGGGKASQRALELLELSRRITRIIERDLFGQRPPDDVPNVVDMRRRARPRQE